MKYYIARMRPLQRIAVALAGAVIATFVIPRTALPDEGQHFGTTHVFIRSAQLNADYTQARCRSSAVPVTGRRSISSSRIPRTELTRPSAR